MQCVFQLLYFSKYFFLISTFFLYLHKRTRFWLLIYKTNDTIILDKLDWRWIDYDKLSWKKMEFMHILISFMFLKSIFIKMV